MPFDADLPPQFPLRDPFRGYSARASGLITPGVPRPPWLDELVQAARRQDVGLDKVQVY